MKNRNMTGTHIKKKEDEPAAGYGSLRGVMRKWGTK